MLIVAIWHLTAETTARQLLSYSVPNAFYMATSQSGSTTTVVGAIPRRDAECNFGVIGSVLIWAANPSRIDGGAIHGIQTRLISAKSIHRHLSIRLSWLQNHARKRRLVHRVREVLAF